MDLDEKEILLQKLAEINAKKVTAETELEIARKKLEEYEEKTKKAENASRMKSLPRQHESRNPHSPKRYRRILKNHGRDGFC